MTNTELIRSRLLKNVPPDSNVYMFSNIDTLRKQWSEEFEVMMRNRLMMGSFRYGGLFNKNRPDYNRIGATFNRLELYNMTGNTEYLVDAANFCLLEFVLGNHKNKHFSSVDDGEHAKEIR